MVGVCVSGLRRATGSSQWVGAGRPPRDRRVRLGRAHPVRYGSERSAGAEWLEGRTLLAAAPAAAGAEFRVNTTTAGSQELFAEAPHAVASDADGDFVVVWSSAGQDGNSWGVFAQRYAADGARRGSEFRVNQATASGQWYPNVACDAAGNFVVAWASANQDGAGDGVYARRYNAAGTALGNEFRVNTTTAGDQRHPTVAAGGGGAFVITWSGYGQTGGAAWDVYAQRYTAAGAPAGPEFRVNGTVTGDQQYASVAADDAGNFIVSWTTDGQDGSGSAVYARRFTAAGVAQGAEIRVNTTTAGNQQYGRVAADADGDFVIAWASANQDGSGRGVFAQRYTAAGTKAGGEFLVNQVTAGEQFAPTVAADDGGGFLVTWTGAQDGDMFGVFARAYDSAGAARGGEFRVNTYFTGNQVYSAAASSGDGKLVVVWQSDGQDGNFFGVYGQRYAAPDIVPPSADIVDVTPDPRTGSVNSVPIHFSEPVTGVTVSDLRLTRNGGTNLLTAAQTLTSSNGGATWTIGNLAPLTAAPGTYTLTLVAAGSGIVDGAGNALPSNASDGWTVSPPPARVTGRYVFYNGSAFDGRDPSAGAADDAAIATDKTALLPAAGRAGFSNYTSFPRGLNGVMIDVAGLAQAAGESPAGSGPAAGGIPLLSTADFVFRFGNTPDATDWGAAPAPASISVRPGAGAGGADRVTLLWSDGAIVGGWLQLTMLATPVTRLTAPDVFYFGNLPGETGDDPDGAAVNAADLAATRAATPGGNAAISSRFDHNRDGRVDVRDLHVVRSAMGADPLPLIGATVAPAASAARGGRGDYRPVGVRLLTDRRDGIAGPRVPQAL